jgi:hypothetical protein
MAGDTKMSGLPAGDPVQAGDLLVVARGSSNFKVHLPTLDQLAAVFPAAASIDLNGQLVRDGLDPQAPTDLATKQYVDGMRYNTVTGTTYTLQLSDNGNCVVCTNVAGCVITVPTDAAVPFPVPPGEPDAAMVLIRAGTSAGPVSVVGTGGVPTIVNPYNSFQLFGRSAEATLMKIGTNVWSFNGEVA